MMYQLGLLIVGFAALASTAPLVQRNLKRVKRSEEVIMYGNHQNNDRVKKSGPISPLPASPLNKEHKEQKEEDTDKQATVQIATVVTKEKIGDNPEKVKENTIVLENPQTGTNKEETLEKNEQEGDMLHDIVAAQEHELEKLEEQGARNDEGQTEEGSGDELPAYADNLWNELLEYYYDYPVYDGEVRKKRSTESKRDKRDLPRSKPLNAEEMTMHGDTKARTKRDLDLDPEDLEYIFGDKYEDEDYPIDGNVRDEDVADTIGDYFRSLAERAYQVDMMNRYYEELTREEEEEVEEELAEQRALQNLETLQEGYGAYEPEYVLSERGYIGSDLVPYNGEQETGNEFVDDWQKRADYSSEEMETAYEPIYYNGQPGIFVPLVEEGGDMDKRQYLSMVPGNKRKRGGYYPSSNEAYDYWKTPVGENEGERQEAMYERLYALAEALKERKQEEALGGVWSELQEK